MTKPPTLAEIDQALIRFADTLSPQEISTKIGHVLTPEQVAARISRLLEARDWLDQAQQDRLITLKMRSLIVELEEMPRSPRNAEVLIRSLEALGNRLDKRNQATDLDLTRLYAFQGAVMLEAFQQALEHVRKQVEPYVPKGAIADTVWADATESGLRHAQIELAKHETPEE